VDHALCFRYSLPRWLTAHPHDDRQSSGRLRSHVR
jgi:hypothetical protein